MTAMVVASVPQEDRVLYVHINISFRPYSKHMLLLACFAMEDVKLGDVPKVLEVRCQGSRECWSCGEALLLLKCNPDLLLHSLLFAFFMW